MVQNTREAALTNHIIEIVFQPITSEHKLTVALSNDFSELTGNSCNVSICVNELTQFLFG